MSQCSVFEGDWERFQVVLLHMFSVFTNQGEGKQGQQ